MNSEIVGVVESIWKQETEVEHVKAKLARLHVGSTGELASYLATADGQKCMLNQRLQELGERTFGARSIKMLRQRILFSKMNRMMHFPLSGVDGDPQLPRVVFTAPHNIPLFRDGCAVHKSEEYTSFLAKHWAERNHAAALCWSEQERKRCGRTPSPDNADPNYMLAADCARNPWFISLQEMYDTSCVPLVHVDIHGCADSLGAPHLYLGLGPLEQIDADKASAFRSSLVRFLEAPLARYSPHTVLEAHPVQRFTAICRDNARLTLTQQSIKLNYMLAVQVELSYSLRRALFYDITLRKEFGEAFANAARDCVNFLSLV